MSQISGHVNVQIHRPFEWTEGSLEFLAGLVGEELQYTPSNIETPWLTVNGNPFGPATNWLARRARMSDTIRRNSEKALQCLVDFRCNEVNGVYRPDDKVTWEKRILEMSDLEYGQFKAWMLHGRTDPITEGQWNKINSALVNFYEAVEVPWGIEMPFALEEVNNKYGGVFKTNGWSVEVSDKSASTPLKPEFVEALLQGAVRVDKDGNDTSTEVSHRDEAIIHYGLGTGMRRQSLVLTTHYEVPDKTDDVLAVVEVPHMTAKGGRGGSALAFEHHIERVRDWANGAGGRGRALLVKKSKDNHKPDDPILITTADADGWKGKTADGKTIQRRWWSTGEDQRRRLVDTDGSSPILFLNMDGTPMSLGHTSDQIKTIADWTRENVNSKFPNGFRLHDLRHTFAVHMAVVVYFGIVNERVALTADSYSERDLKSAIQMVTVSLTHATSNTTMDSYLLHAGEQLLAIGRTTGEERKERLAAYTGEDV